MAQLRIRKINKMSKIEKMEEKMAKRRKQMTRAFTLFFLPLFIVAAIGFFSPFCLDLDKEIIPLILGISFLILVVSAIPILVLPLIVLKERNACINEEIDNIIKNCR